MEGFPPIEPGHIAYVVLWALIGMVICAVAWPRRHAGYKEYLTGTLGISLEALGVEIAGGQPALVVPLFFGLGLAMMIRHLPDEVRAFQRNYSRGAGVRRVKRAVLVFTFFISQVAVLLLAYRGWWDRLLMYPGA